MAKENEEQWQLTSGVQGVSDVVLDRLLRDERQERPGQDRHQPAHREVQQGPAGQQAEGQPPGPDPPRGEERDGHDRREDDVRSQKA